MYAHDRARVRSRLCCLSCFDTHTHQLKLNRISCFPIDFFCAHTYSTEQQQQHESRHFHFFLFLSRLSMHHWRDSTRENQRKYIYYVDIHICNKMREKKEMNEVE